MMKIKHLLSSLASAIHARAITPSDTVDIDGVAEFGATRAIYVGTAGHLVVVMADGETVTIPKAPAGYHPLCATRVLATGTTADDLCACW